jgi:hypothetical protein
MTDPRPATGSVFYGSPAPLSSGRGAWTMAVVTTLITAFAEFGSMTGDREVVVEAGKARRGA